MGNKACKAAFDHDRVGKAVDKGCVEPGPEPSWAVVELHHDAVAGGDAVPTEKDHGASCQPTASLSNSGGSTSPARSAAGRYQRTFARSKCA